MEEKMCRYYYGSTIEEREDGACHKYTKCPQNTNSKCEIVAKKPKMVRVKAWAWVNNATKKILFTSTTPNGICEIPCTILIDEKYLKEKK